MDERQHLLNPSCRPCRTSKTSSFMVFVFFPFLRAIERSVRRVGGRRLIYAPFSFPSIKLSSLRANSSGDDLYSTRMNSRTRSVTMMTGFCRSPILLFVKKQSAVESVRVHAAST